jgi:hypothetical protein
MDKVTYPCKNVKMQTPWGKSDFKTVYQRGISFVNTPGHGGLQISKALAAKILSDKAIRVAGQELGGYVWFEEDCAIFVAALDSETILTHLAAESGKTQEEMKARALESVTHWYPDYLK